MQAGGRIAQHDAASIELGEEDAQGHRSQADGGFSKPAGQLTVEKVPEVLLDDGFDLERTTGTLEVSGESHQHVARSFDVRGRATEPPSLFEEGCRRLEQVHWGGLAAAGAGGNGRACGVGRPSRRACRSRSSAARSDRAAPGSGARRRRRRADGWRMHGAASAASPVSKASPPRGRAAAASAASAPAGACRAARERAAPRPRAPARSAWPAAPAMRSPGSERARGRRACPPARAAPCRPCRSARGRGESPGRDRRGRARRPRRCAAPSSTAARAERDRASRAACPTRQQQQAPHLVLRGHGARQPLRPPGRSSSRAGSSSTTPSAAR